MGAGADVGAESDAEDSAARTEWKRPEARAESTTARVVLGLGPYAVARGPRKPACAGTVLDSSLLVVCGPACVTCFCEARELRDPSRGEIRGSMLNRSHTYIVSTIYIFQNRVWKERHAIGLYSSKACVRNGCLATWVLLCVVFLSFLSLPCDTVA